MTDITVRFCDACGAQLTEVNNKLVSVTKCLAITGIGDIEVINSGGSFDGAYLMSRLVEINAVKHVCNVECLKAWLQSFGSIVEEAVQRLAGEVKF